jgi:predicted ABC-type transport system involved in lysophospholipase L1 biosynthesis ATPase subunit
VLGLVERVHAEQGQTIVLITHNEQVARRASRLVRMRDGRILAD